MRRAMLWVIVLSVVAFAIGVVALSGCGGTESTTTAVVEETTTSAAAEETTTTAAAYTLIEPGKLIIGSDTTFPPFESLNGTVVEGFDVDMMNAMGKILGLEIVFQTETFDSLIPTLKAGGKFDIIVSALTITDERAKEVDFSDGYMDVNQAIAVKKDSTFTSEADLVGKRLAVQSGATNEVWAKENLTGVELVPYKSTTDSFIAVQAGNVDAVISDASTLAVWVADPSKEMKIMKEYPTGEQLGIAVSKDNPALLAAINDALAQVMADKATWNTWYEKWLGVVPQ